MDDFEKYVDERIRYLNTLLEEPNRIMQAHVNRAINERLTAQELDRSLSVINSKYDEIQEILSAFSDRIIPDAYNSGVDISSDTLRQVNALFTKNTRDIKTINFLINDMQKNYNGAIEMGRESVATYFNLSKQVRISEQDISKAVAQGLMDGGTGEDAKRALRNMLEDSSNTIYDRDKLMKFAAGYEDKLEDGKFMQIINKNGDVMNFKTDSYADMVARTRIGDAQVAGAVDIAEENGVNEFNVTDHHTTTAICIPHEGQIYTTNPNNKKYEQLYPDNKPVYHPNCLHRLMPYVDILRSEYND